MRIRQLVCINRLLVALLLIPLLFQVLSAFALPSDDEYMKGVSKQLQQGSSSSLKLPSSPLTTADTDSNEAVSPKPAPNQTKFDFKVPPMAGFQQLAGAKPMKEMLKRLITAEVPVMYQTMMMVENGAATGFIGSMNTVGSLLSNTIQASQLQMDIFDSVDRSGQRREEFVRSAYNDLQDEAGNKNIWPAALFHASGDRVNPDQTPAPFEKFVPNKHKTGSAPVVLADPKDESKATGGPSGESKILLSEILFSKANNENIDQLGDLPKHLKESMLDWVGDVNLTSEPVSDYSDMTKAKIILAKKYDIMGPPEPGVNSPYDKLRLETKELVWEHFNKVMKAYCEFKKNNPNKQAAMFDKKRPAKFIEERAIDSWKEIHSLDIKPSVNLIDQLFKLFVAKRNISEVNCETFKGDRNDMPELDKESSEQTTGGGGGDGKVFDSCETSPKTCLRNVVMFRITMFIVESQVNYLYRSLFEDLYKFAHSETSQVNLSHLFCKNLHMSWPCDPGSEFSTRIEDNSLQWIQFANKLSRFAQGQGGSSVFRPSPDNSTLGAAGSVAAPRTGGGS